MWQKTPKPETKISRQMGDYFQNLGNPWKSSLAQGNPPRVSQAGAWQVGGEHGYPGTRYTRTQAGGHADGGRALYRYFPYLAQRTQ